MRKIKYKSEYPLEYWIWQAIKQRCYNSNNKEYKNYGARGIEICDRWWNSFENFIDDMGPRPMDKNSIERINNNGNYEPDNCKWATWQEQANNHRPIFLTKEQTDLIIKLYQTGIYEKRSSKIIQC